MTYWGLAINPWNMPRSQAFNLYINISILRSTRRQQSKVKFQTLVCNHAWQPWNVIETCTSIYEILWKNGNFLLKFELDLINPCGSYIVWSKIELIVKEKKLTENKFKKDNNNWWSDPLFSHHVPCFPPKSPTCPCLYELVATHRWIVPSLTTISASLDCSWPYAT